MGIIRTAHDGMHRSEGAEWRPNHVRMRLNQEITMDVIRILLAIVLPPLGVFLQVGIGLHFWINILLTLLGYVPGIIHAIWVIVKK